MVQKNPLQFFSKLKAELSSLPGEAAHRDMIPFRVTASEALQKPTDYRLSAVMILLYPKNEHIHFVLTQRHNYGGKHSGQISFPGGKAEEFDKNTAFTALRETEEEIGIAQTSVNVLGQLTDVYIPVSRFLVHPYIGTLTESPHFTPDPREVKHILEFTLEDLLNDTKRISTKIKLDNGVVMKDMPAFEFERHIVWGATAIILNELKWILNRMID